MLWTDEIYVRAGKYKFVLFHVVSSGFKVARVELGSLAFLAVIYIQTCRNNVFYRMKIGRR